MSFGAALGAAGRGFAPAFYQGSDFWQKYQQHQLEQEAAKAYGGAMSGMGTPRPGMSGPMSMPSTGTFQPYPMPPAPGVSPQQYGQQPTPPGTPVSQPGGPQPQMPFPRPKPAMPMQQPQAPQQMPQQGPSQPQIMPPNSPMPQGPMRDITPRNMSGAGNPGQMQQGGGGQGPFQGMNIQQVIGAIKQHAPGISDEALGMAVDRFMPMLNADAQFQWRTMVDQRAQRQLDERSAWHDRRGDQYDRGLDLKASGQQATNDRFQQREGRLKEREARVNVARLPPEQAAQQKFFGQRFNEMSKAANNAYTNLTRLQSYGGTPEAIGSAQEEYTRYDALRWQAEADYDRFLDTLGGTPAAAPAAPAAKPAAAAPARPSAAAPAKTPIGKGPAGQDLFPVGPQSGRAPDDTSEWNGEGGPTSDDEVYDPDKSGWYADRASWSGNKPGVPPKTQPSAPRRPVETPAQAPRSQGARPRPKPPVPQKAQAEPEGMYGYDERGRALSRPVKGQNGYGVKPVWEEEPVTADVGEGQGGPWQNVDGDYEALRPILRQEIQRMLSAPRMDLGTAERGAKRQKFNQEFDRLRPKNDKRFTDERRQASRYNSESEAAENEEMPGGHMQIRFDNIKRHIQELEDWFAGITQGPDELTRARNVRALPDPDRNKRQSIGGRNQ